MSFSGMTFNYGENTRVVPVILPYVDYSNYNHATGTTIAPLQPFSIYDSKIPVSDFETFSFERCQSHDIVIETVDKKELQFPKNLLIVNSKYLKKMFENDQTGALNAITLPYKSTTLVMIFNCITNVDRLEYFKKCCLEKLDNIDDIFDFAIAFTKCFDLISIKDAFQDYFSEESQIKKLCCNRLIHLVNESEMEKIGNALSVILSKDREMFKTLKFEEFTDLDIMNFFGKAKWSLFVQSLEAWTNSNNPSDEKMTNIIKIDFKAVPYDFVADIHKILHSLTDCLNFKVKVYEELTFIRKKEITYVKPIKKQRLLKYNY